jgi:hypothetical protein
LSPHPWSLHSNCSTNHDTLMTKCSLVLGVCVCWHHCLLCNGGDDGYIWYCRWWVINIHFDSVWYYIFLITFLLHAGNVNDANYGFSQDRYTFMSDFGYDPQPYLPYPTCSLKKGRQISICPITKTMIVQF